MRFPTEWFDIGQMGDDELMDIMHSQNLPNTANYCPSGLDRLSAEIRYVYALGLQTKVHYWNVGYL